MALGGVVGTVFSFRDQRRTSQMHELAVGSEVSSQRRTEQSYSSFLDESQKTLTLVNDTLALAKEATDRAAHTMQRRASASVAAIEGHARNLLEPILDRGEFEAILDETKTRTDLERLAGELRAIEGYLMLQDIELPPFSRFVKGMAEYLDDDLDAALRTLREAARDVTVLELQQFAVYWEARLNIALGRFPHADELFSSGARHVSSQSMKRAEFQTMADDTRFFLKADQGTFEGPAERLGAVWQLLRDLQEVGEDWHRGGHDARSRTSHQIADARADVFAWIAHEPSSMTQPFDQADLAPLDLPLTESAIADDGTVILGTDTVAILGTLPDVRLRVWALRQAEIIYGREDVDSLDDLGIDLGVAECHFRLRENEPGQASEYRDVHRKALDELSGGHRERRDSVEFAGMVHLAAARLLILNLSGSDAGLRKTAEDELTRARSALDGILAEIRDDRVTLWSHLQRRPLQRQDYMDELKAFTQQIATVAEPGTTTGRIG